MDRYLQDVSGDRIGRNIQVTISERFEDAETFASADQEPVLGLDETEHPGVSVHGRRFCGQQIESFGFDVGHQSRMRPGHVRNRPVGGRTLEGRRDLYHESLAYPQFDVGGVGYHLDYVAVGGFVAGLSLDRSQKRRILLVESSVV